MPSEKRELRTETVSITVTPTERAMVDMMLAIEDRSMASMLRILIREGFATRGLRLTAEASDGTGA